MKPTFPEATSHSCSCTSCMYRSESERPSLRHIIVDGSRIDKLYFGKYIPLRERKLLAKLVRTRAVYDDIRNQLLSESDVSIRKKANLKPRKHKQERQIDLRDDKSSAILELVDMVDEGKVVGPKVLSECCSCCSCGLDIPHTHKYTSEMHKHKRNRLRSAVSRSSMMIRQKIGDAKRRIAAHEHRISYTMSGSSLVNKRRMRGAQRSMGVRHGHSFAETMSRNSTMVRQKIGEARKIIRSKVKSIRSAPCTCTSELSSMMKHRSQEMMRRLRPDIQVGEQIMFEGVLSKNRMQPHGRHSTKKEYKRGKLLKKSYQKLKKSRAKLIENMGEGVKKFRESKTILVEHLENTTKKSLEKLQDMRNKTKEAIKGVVEKSANKRQGPVEVENPQEFRIKKDSITKFREKGRNRSRLLDYECEPDICIPGECVPENCFKIIKLRRVRREKKQKEKIGVEKSVGQRPSVSEIGVQAYKKGAIGVTDTGRTHNMKVVTKTELRDTETEPRKSLEVESKKINKTIAAKGKNKNFKCECEEVNFVEPPTKKKSVKSMTSVLPGPEKRPKVETKQKETIIEPRNALYVVSREANLPQFTTQEQLNPQRASQTKLRYPVKQAQTESQALKRFTLKMAGKGYKPSPKPYKSISTAIATQPETRGMNEINMNVESHVQTKPLNHRVGTKQKRRSISSVTSASKSMSTSSKNIRAHAPNKTKKDQIPQSKRSEFEADQADHKQAVRISSSFSFNIEFYKDKPSESPVKPKHEKVSLEKHKSQFIDTQKRNQLKHKHSQISSSTGISKYTLTKHRLRRCFCTLKLGNQNKKKTKPIERSVGSSTSQQQAIQYIPDSKRAVVNFDKAIATYKQKKPELLPYEYEPGICVPGECNPYACQEIINKRQKKYFNQYSNTQARHSKTRHTNTHHREARSMSSFTSKSKPNKVKKVQSTIGASEKRHNDNSKTPRRIKTAPSSPNRQVVRVGSSFSFNIEFYKDNNNKIMLSPASDNLRERTSNNLNTATKPHTKDRGYQDKKNKKHQISTSMLVKKKNKSSFLAPMKRCFCTLKLQTKGRGERKKVEYVTTGTETPVENSADQRNVLLTRGTKTKPQKLKFKNSLEPYECEPGICVPGECDPYKCLQRIQKRQLKESGTLTDKAKMRSVTSVTERKRFGSRSALARSKLRDQKVFTGKHKYQAEYQKEEPILQRQAVHLSSNFSFNIEFRKDLSAPFPVQGEYQKDMASIKPAKKIKNKGEETSETTSSHQYTQASVTKAHKAAGIRPILKRCFCTLKLQSNHNSKNKTFLKPPKVLTVSRVTATGTKIKSHSNVLSTSFSRTNQIMASHKIQDKKWETVIHDGKSLSSTISKSSGVFRYKEMKSYFRNNSLVNNNLKLNKPCSKLAYSNIILPTIHTKVKQYTFSENCIIKRREDKSLHFNNRKRYHKQSISEGLPNLICYPRINPLRHQRYYTMNIQIPKKVKRHKLKSYECEPGICVPGVCNPYDCQKLIMQRLGKTVSRMSGTNYRSKSMSSSTAQSISSSKKLQSKQTREKAKKVPARGMTFKALPNQNHKQAVRVGSSFSFNIEFSKDHSSPHTIKKLPLQTPRYQKPVKPPKINVNNRGTKGQGIDYRDQDIQSSNDTENKGSGMNPMMQRCFCTLKLQKKGKNIVKREKAVQQAFERGTGTPPNTLKEFIDSRAMFNAAQNTAPEKQYKLLPYECEPQVCVPGECDPYECLERIKKRNKNLKDSGTGTIRNKFSSGSMTDSYQYRTQRKQAQSKLRDKKTKARGSAETRSHQVQQQKGRPSRQAVRIGSSFSFNVEFYKENSQSQPTKVQKEPQRPSIDIVKYEKPKTPKKKLKDTALQDLKNLRHRDSQIDNLSHVKSTMTTSLMKRCFCTAKLHHKQNKKPRPKEQKLVEVIPVHDKASQIKVKKTFLKRCFCVMEKLKGGKLPDHQKKVAEVVTEPASKPKTMDKKNATHRYKTPRHDLAPYECEPGICVPGECNPYACEKLINARNLRLQTRGVLTEGSGTRSTSSNYSSRTSKARRTQSKFKASSSSTRPTKKFKEIQPVDHISNSNRQVVRIGSNFSFNVEFYKDRSPNTEELQAAAKAIRTKVHQRQKKETKKTGKKHHGTTEHGSMGSNETFNQETQANKNKMEDRGTGFGPALKRCFCTLKLQNREKEHLQSTSQGTETAFVSEIPTLYTRAVNTGKNRKLKPYECEPEVCVPPDCNPYACEKLIKKRHLKETTKAVMTKGNEKQIGYKLLPYECEPNFCVPGQCNPYECDKRIKLRNMKYRDSGTFTGKYRGKSVSSEIRSTSGSKAKKAQYKPKKKSRRRSKSVSSKPARPRKIQDRTARQSVRIGSGFSFDVEFYKDRSFAKADTISRPVKQNVKPSVSTSSSANQNLTQTKNIKLQHRRNVRDTESQILALKMRDAGVNTFLKRCFCTLKLQKSGDMVSNNKIISRAARDKNVYLATLLPYECEPGICIPGKCDPYECQRRIQKRLMRSQLSGTERTNQDSSTSSTAGARHIATSSQAQRPQKQKRQKTTYARTNDIALKPSSDQSSSRQAVRMGSSFSFDVEFFKDRISNVPRDTYTVPKQREHRTKPKPRKKRSQSVTSSEMRRQHQEMQTGSKTESKSTGLGPKLKRCFCTLALHKRKSQPTTRTKSTFRNDDLSDLYAFSRNVGVGTGKKMRHLKPYECEPGVCIPGQCDPYQCYEIIKRRMRDSGTATVNPEKKYASSITSGNAKYKSANTQSVKDRRRREMPTMTVRERAPCVPCGKTACPPCNNNRQAVRIGSNFSFSVEFYKERPNAMKMPKAVNKIKAPESNVKLNKHNKFSNRPNAMKMPKAVNKIKAPESNVKLNKHNKFSNTRKYYTDRQSPASGRSGNDQKCQADCIKHTSRGTTMGAFLKRCFCTLNLQKNKMPSKPNKMPYKSDNRPSKSDKGPKKPDKGPKKSGKKPIQADKSAIVQTDDKYIKNKLKKHKLLPYECEPNICVPGECNPHACEETIKRRNIRRHSRRTGTHMRSSQVSVGSMASRLVPRSSRQVQSNAKRIRNTSRSSQQLPRVVEQPRFATMFDSSNRTGVKVGSNVTFNIEFYKDKSQGQTCDDPERCEGYKPKELKKTYVKRKSTFSESRPKPMDKGIGHKLDRRSSETQAAAPTMIDKAAGMNLLKRCFCTLKLQKKAHRPKIITVNRLAVEYPNGGAYKYMRDLKNQERPLPIHQNKMNIQQKPSRGIKHKNLVHDGLSHPEKETRDIEMTTIYPYIPYKFNKNISKTVLLRSKDICKICPAENTCQFNKRYEPLSTKHTHRYKTEKSDDNYIDINTPDQRQLKPVQKLKSFFNRIFSSIVTKSKKNIPENGMHPKKYYSQLKMSENRNNNKHNTNKLDTLKTSKSDRRPNDIKLISMPKKTMSLKAAKVPKKIMKRSDNVFYNQTGKTYSRFQAGDSALAQTTFVGKTRLPKSIFPESDNISWAQSNELYNKNKINTRSPFETNKIVQMSLIRNRAKSKNVKSTNTTYSKTRSKGVGANSENNNLLKKCLDNCKKNNFSSGDSPLPNGKDRKKLNKKNKLLPSSDDPLPNKEGKSKRKKKRVGFDSTSMIKNKDTKKRKSSGDAPAILNEPLGKNKKKKQKKGACDYPTTCPCCKGNKKNGMSAGDFKLGKGKVKPILTETGKKTKKNGFEKSVARKKPLDPNHYGAKITVRGKGDPTARKNILKTTTVEKGKYPCVCGSTICLKETEKLKAKIKRKAPLTGKPCTCGSAPCAHELKKEQDQKKLITSLVCVCSKEVIKAKQRLKENAKADKKWKKDEKKLTKMFEAEDKRRLKARMKEDKLKEKQVKKFKSKTSDIRLAAESFLDVLKLGLKTSGDLARCAQRAAFHPKYTYGTMKSTARNPAKAMSFFKMAVSSSGVASTMRRVEARFKAMRRVKKLKSKLEENAVTHFMLHMFDKDARKRMARKKRMTRRREPIDFECSLFMATLRRRPCLSVYYSCPWFYPHCLSMLTLWKQFTDIMLFLIAVTVWSPCIVAMEVCRAAMCCFFCTG